jgi:hypothetical protein
LYFYSSKKKARENNVPSGHVTDVTVGHVTSGHVTSSNAISGDVFSGSTPFPNKLWLQKQQISGDRKGRYFPALFSY